MTREEHKQYLGNISTGELLADLDDTIQKLCKADNVTWAKKNDEDIWTYRRIRSEIYNRLNK